MVRIALLLVALGMLAGCASTVRLMPTPTLLTVGEPGIVDVDLAAYQDMTIDVLFATNRIPAGPADARHYTRLRSDDLRLGVATLQVGGGPRSRAASRAAPAAAAPGERPEIRLRAIREMAVLEQGSEVPGPDAVAFFAQVDQLLGRGGIRSLLIYMPGANTTFERAAAQAAQFQHFMGRDAVVMVFAWPSAGTLLRYRRDVATARRSVPAFALLLEQLSKHTHAAHVDVLAYSAGAMIVSPGLALVAADADVAGEPGQLRLHAPPPARGLDPNSTERSIAFWTFPADYETRLSALVRQLAAGQGP